MRCVGFYAERLVHKPGSHQRQAAQRHRGRQADDLVVPSFLEEYKLAPSPQQAEILRARFDRIFKRGATGYVMLDRLLRRLFRHKDALLRVLERPEIPLNTNASENDIRAFVTKKENLRRHRQP